MDRRRQSIFYFIAAALFGIAFLAEAGRHGFGTKTFVAALLTMILAALGTKVKREEDARGDRDS
ncbi:MAG: hypothetical protein JO013_02880 [Alphaproteobacteria bacterium]|nr:hypothetical protein [Alphaproteobacteria bacterium]